MSGFTELLKIYRGLAINALSDSFFASHMMLAVDPEKNCLATNNSISENAAAGTLKALLAENTSKYDEFTLSRIHSTLSLLGSTTGTDDLLFKVSSQITDQDVKERKIELEKALSEQKKDLKLIRGSNSTLTLKEIQEKSEFFCSKVAEEFADCLNIPPPKYQLVKDPANLGETPFLMFVRKLENETSDVYFDTTRLNFLREGTLWHIIVHELCGHVFNFGLMHQKKFRSEQDELRSLVIPYSEDLFYVEFVAQLAAAIYSMFCQLEAKTVELEHRIFNYDNAVIANTLSKYLHKEIDRARAILIFETEIDRTSEEAEKLFSAMIANKESSLVKLVYGCSYCLVSKVLKLSDLQIKKFFLKVTERTLSIDEINDLITEYKGKKGAKGK